jgi:hypothetical protein
MSITVTPYADALMYLLTESAQSTSIDRSIALVGDK